MQGLVGKNVSMTARQDERTDHWYYRTVVHFPDGRRKRISGLPGPWGLPNTKNAALEAERLRINQVLATGEVKPTPPPEPQKKEMPTLSTFAPLFLDVARLANKPSSVLSKELVLRRHILPRLGALPLNEVDYAQVEDFKLHLATKRRKSGGKLKPKSINNILAALHRMLTIAKKRGILTAIPEFEWLHEPPPEFDFFSFEEAPRILAAASGEWKTMARVAMRTGLRRGELLALRWEDLDLKAGKMLVRQNIVRGHIGTPKSGKPREIPLGKATVAALKAHRHLRGELVFCTQDGGVLDTNRVHRALTGICVKAGLRCVGWHTMRHTFASHLAMRNVPLKAIQELMGHATIQMTMRYAHLMPGVTSEAVEQLDSPGVAAGWQRMTEISAND
jgi:integrase